MKRFGEKLRILRKQRGLTLQQLARELGLSSHSHLSKIETGINLPSVTLAIKIADVFGVTMDQLLRDELEVES